MNQRFIELGPGYSDLYELLELAKANQYRMHYFLCFIDKIRQKMYNIK